MSQVRIFRPARTAMQSGIANTRKWVLEYEPEGAKRIDPLMGWSGSADTRQQIRLRFESKDDAVAYAKRNGMDYTVDEPHPRRVVHKNYADKFAWDRVS